MQRPLIAMFVAAISLSNSVTGQPPDLQPIGEYSFHGWDGPAIGVHYSIPTNAGPETPILVVVPGARRNAAEYRDQWSDLSRANGLIVLALSFSAENFPSEFEYNAGGVLTADGKLRPNRVGRFRQSNHFLMISS